MSKTIEEKAIIQYAKTKAYRDEYYKRPDVKKKLIERNIVGRINTTIKRLETHTYEELIRLMAMVCEKKEIDFDEHKQAIDEVIAIFTSK